MENKRLWELNTTLNATQGDVSHTNWLTPFGVFVAIAMTLTVLLNLLLNPLMFITLRRAAGTRCSTKIILGSLTLSDLLAALCQALTLPELYIGAWMLGGFLCVTVKLLLITSYFMGIMSLLLLTIDRFIAVAFPLRYPQLMTTRKAKTAVCITWATSSILVILLYGVYNHSVVSPQHPKICQQTLNDWRMYISGVLVTLTLIVIIVLYTRISFIAHRHARDIAIVNRVRQAKRQQFNARATVTILIITSTLAVTWIPSIAFFVSSESEFWDYETAALTDVLALSNGWLNVVIYYLRNPFLRQALCDLLSAKPNCFCLFQSPSPQ
ncbi:prolactin-releasing peptide receptor-like [Acanthaster planci]|uniref:Prolactin-releasing peptide receptor-like n=1 Tax=Acanthaster planci TaxID=133434 RepID=A0A8B7Y4G5_ACAPL|nr:prolactin-releasing peptide receptor-like [Acanthaster planci]